MRFPHTSFLERFAGGVVAGTILGFFAYLIYCVIVTIVQVVG